jgi:hypothetical protein
VIPIVGGPGDNREPSFCLRDTRTTNENNQKAASGRSSRRVLIGHNVLTIITHFRRVLGVRLYEYEVANAAETRWTCLVGAADVARVKSVMLDDFLIV